MIVEGAKKKNGRLLLSKFTRPTRPVSLSFFLNSSICVHKLISCFTTVAVAAAAACPWYHHPSGLTG